MSRPLRIDVEGGWYHVTARGIERRAIFQEVRDYEHFLGLLEEMTSRYGVELHAYALMVNHYHLLIRTPQANASAAIQWLNVSYSVWFNRKRGRVGHVFQGRFTSILIDGEGSWTLNASVYVHLNPVRTMNYGLGKAANRAEGLGLVKPGREELTKRLKGLRTYRWSSFPAYAGYEKIPEWLITEELLKRAGGLSAYRRYVQTHVNRGIEPEGLEDISGLWILGARKFQDRVKKLVGRVTKEQPSRKWLKRCVDIETIIKLVERNRGEKWIDFSRKHGDWGRELVLYLARKLSGLTLRQIGEKLGGLDYKTTGKAVQRFESSLANDAAKRKMVKECLNELSFVET
jgi:putative transposase